MTENIYKINKDTIVESTSYKRPGIHENMTLVEAKYDQLPSGAEFLGFYFEDEEGVKLSYTEWPINTQKPLEAMSEEEKEKYLKRIKYQMTTLRYLIEAFIGRELTDQDNIEGNSFKELAENIIKTLGNYKTKKVRIKAAYDRNSYVTVAKSPFNRYIESMDIPKAQSEVEMTDRDLIERPKKDVEKHVENPFEEGTSPKVNEDEIPF